MMIYKILPRSLWEDAAAKGWFYGAGIDHADGYIHFSTAAQSVETAAKHFAGQGDLMLFAVDPRRIKDGALKWEPSRGGDLFPHLYRALKTSDIAWIQPLPLGDAGHMFPQGMA